MKSTHVGISIRFSKSTAKKAAPLRIITTCKGRSVARYISVIRSRPSL